MQRCSAITAAGEACMGIPVSGDDKCYMHAASTLEARKRAGARGGKLARNGRPITELHEIKALLEDLTNGVLEGRVQTNVAAVANQLINTRLRAVEVERKIRETEELEERLEALERQVV